MKQSEIESRVEQAAVAVARELGLDILDVELTRESGTQYLKVFIDRPGGRVDLTDCERVSRGLGQWLDEADPVAGEFLLEVSSPGLDRPLKKDRDYQRYRGRMVEVTLYAPVSGQKQFVGCLEGLRGEEVVLKQDGREVVIPRSQIAAARLHVEI